MNKYYELMEKQRAEMAKLPLIFAFSKAQFKKGLEDLGYTEKDKPSFCHIGVGGYIHQDFIETYVKTNIRHQEELEEHFQDEEFIYHMFRYELDNHEYSYTRDLGPTLDALGFTLEEVQNKDKLFAGLKRAVKEVTK